MAMSEMGLAVFGQRQAVEPVEFHLESMREVYQTIRETQEEVGGSLTFRVKTPSGGGKAFDILTGDEEQDTSVPSFQGAIVFQHKCNALFDEEMSGNTPPLCSSIDGIRGLDAGTGEVRSCRGCPHNEYGTAKKGRGKACKKKLDLLNLFWEPGISDIQQSRNLFSVELMDNRTLESRYPQLKGQLGGDVIDVARYIYDDTVDTSEKTVVVDWYYKTEGVDGGKRLHYVKFAGETVLFASENEPEYQDRGFYDHGEYPVVFDTLFLEEGTPAGFGYVDIMRDAQGYIDRLGGAILKNSLVGARPRFFIKDTGAVNEKEFADVSKDFVHVAGQLDDGSLRQITVEPVSSMALNVLQMKIDELKETSGNRDFSQGSTASGVTAASAIAALQEAGSKLSRDMNKSGYRAFQKINYLCIELIRQFYDEPRSFRITGEQGAEEFAVFDNRRLRPSQTEGVFGVDTGYRRPVFDIVVTSQKASPFNTIAQNELAKELFSMGFFNPELSDQALCAVDLMDFEGKELVRRKITQNGTLFQMVQQMQAQMQKMAMIIDAQNGTSVSGEVAGMVPAMGAPGEAAADGTAAAMDAMGRESATSTAGKARTRAAETATPR